MKKVICSLFICSAVLVSSAQVDVTNGGILSISGSTDILFVNGNFTNSSEATLANSGKIYVKQNFANSQTAWTVGTGEVILNGTGVQLISSASSSPFYKLTVDKPSGLATLSSAVTINNTLTLTTGKLSLDNYDMTMTSSASISGAGTNTYLIATGTGELKQQIAALESKTFPVGTSSAYMPATIALTGGSTTDVFSIRMLTAFYSQGTTGSIINSNVVGATWMISETNAGGSDASLTLQWPLSLELSGFNRTYSRVAHYTSGAWEYGLTDIAASGANPYTVTRSGITSFSPFGVAMNMAVLPVTWLELSGKNNGNENHITWSTATEVNNAYFSIEASINGTTFTEVGRVAGAGNSNSVQAYNFIHYNINGQSYFYRMKQVDVDGRAVYSKVIRINITVFGFTALYPNPVQDKTTLNFTLQRSSLVAAIITDASGMLVYKYSQQYDKGNNKMNLDLGPLSAGIYILSLEDDSGNKQTFRFIKTN